MSENERVRHMSRINEQAYGTSAVSHTYAPYLSSIPCVYSNARGLIREFGLDLVDQLLRDLNAMSCLPH